MEPKVMPFRSKIIYGSAEKSYGSARKIDNKSFHGSNEQENQNLTSFEKFHSTESSPNSAELPLYRRSYTHTEINNGVKVTIHRSNGYSRNSSLSDASSSTSIEKELKAPKPSYSRNTHYEFRYNSPANEENVAHPLIKSNNYESQGIYEEYNRMDRSLENGIKKLQEMDKKLENYENIYGNYSKRMESQNKDKDLGQLNEMNNQLRETVNALNKKKDEYMQDNLVKEKKLKLNEQTIVERTNRIKDLEHELKVMEMKILRLEKDCVNKSDSEENAKEKDSILKKLEGESQKVLEISQAIKLQKELFESKVKSLEEKCASQIEEVEYKYDDEIRKIKQYHKNYVEELKEKLLAKNENLKAKDNENGLAEKNVELVINLKNKIKEQEKELVETRKLIEGTFEEANKSKQSKELDVPRIEKLKTELIEKDSIIEYLSKINKREEDEIKKLTEVKGNLLLSVSKLQKEIETIQSNKRNSEELCDEEIEKVKLFELHHNCVLKQEIEYLKQYKEELQLTIEENKISFYSLNREIESLKVQNLKASAEHKTLISEYNNKLLSSEYKVREMEGQIMEMKLIESQFHEKQEEQLMIISKKEVLLSSHIHELEKTKEEKDKLFGEICEFKNRLSEREEEISALTDELQKMSDSLKSEEHHKEQFSHKYLEAIQKYDKEQSSIQELIVSIQKELISLEKEDELRVCYVENKVLGEDLVSEFRECLEVYKNKIKEVCQINCQEIQKLRQEIDKQEKAKQELFHKQTQTYFETNSFQCQTQIFHLELLPQVFSENNLPGPKEILVEMAINTDEMSQQKETCILEEKAYKELEILKEELSEKENILEVMESCIDDYKAMVKEMKEKLEHQDIVKCCYEEILNMFEIEQKPNVKVHDEVMEIICVMISKLSNVESLEEEIKKLNNENVDLKDRKINKFYQTVDKVSFENDELRTKIFELTTRLEERNIYITELIKVINDTNEQTIRNYMKLWNHKVQFDTEYDNDDNKSSFSFDEPCFSLTKTNSHLKSSATSEVLLFVEPQSKSLLKTPINTYFTQYHHNEFEGNIFEEQQVTSNEEPSCLTPPTISLDQEDFLAKFEERVLRSPELIDYKQDSKSEEVTNIMCVGLE